MSITRPAHDRRRRTAPFASIASIASIAAVVAVLALAGCGSSAGSDGAAGTTEPAEVTTSAPETTTTGPSVTTTNPPATTTTTAPPADLTPEQTAVAFVRALAEGQPAVAYVRDPAVATDAERQLGEMGTAAYDSIALDPAVSMSESGAADECAVNDVTFSCYVLIDRSSSDSEGVNTLLRIGVAVNDLDGVTSPDQIGPEVPAHVVSVEIVPA